jgi:hypothetical protein
MRAPNAFHLLCLVITGLSGCRGAPAPANEPSSAPVEPATNTEPTSNTEVAAGAPATAAAEMRFELIPEPEPRAPLTQALATDLREWAKPEPVVLAGTDSRLFATDGQRERTLIQAEIFAGRYDPKRQVIWFRSGAQLLALDLLEASYEPHVILDEVAEDISIALPDAGLWFGSGGVPEFLSLEWRKRPKIEVGITFDDVVNESVAKAIEAAKLVDTAWLGVLAKRKVRSVPPPPKSKRYIDAPLAECDSNWSTSCGNGVEWPNSSWKLYVSQYDCGDYCYWACGLWDSKTGHTADPYTLPSPVWDPNAVGVASSCGPFFSDASGTMMLIHGQLCRAEQCTPLSGHALGFLDPGPTIEASP